MLSELKPYSLGIVAENKALSEWTIEVTPIEDSPMLNGEINSDKVSDTVNSIDAQGGQYEVAVKTANSIKATWLPGGSHNRSTPPDVRRGERVMIYRYSDEDKFYWVDLFSDLRLRKLETVIYAWSGSKDDNTGKGYKVNPDDYYYLEISTHKKLVHFSTSVKNGEFCKYDIQINADEGFIQIKDDKGQLFMLDSKAKQLVLKNADDCYVELREKNMAINVPETLTVTAKNVVEKIVQKITTEAGSDVSVKAANYSLNSSGKIDEKAGGPITINGSGVKISKGVALS